MSDEPYQSVARAVARKGLTVPAVLLLELVRPLSFLCIQVLRVGAPVLDPLTCDAPSRAARWLDDPAGLEALLRAIEDVGLSERGD